MVSVVLDDFRFGTSLEVDLRYKAHPGEPMVRYYPDGSGYPGSPPEAELLDVRVVSWTVNGEKMARTKHWVWTDLDRLAHEIIERDWEKYEQVCLEDASEREYESRKGYDD